MSYEVDEPRYRSMPDQIADHLAVQIALGNLKPGQRLLENEISNERRVSRPPVREALRLLQAQGVVWTQPNRGTFVTDLTIDEFTEIFVLRLTVERAALTRVMANKKLTREIDTKFGDVMRDLHNAALIGDQLAFCQADLSFHERLVNLSDSALLVPAWHLLARGLLIFVMREHEEIFSYKASLEDHERLLSLIQSGDEAAAHEEIGSHIMSTLETLRNAPRRGLDKGSETLNLKESAA